MTEEAAIADVGSGVYGGEHHEHHLSEDFGDKRGLTALGGASIAVGLGLVGAIIDVTTGSGLRLVFGVLFILGCVISAARVHTEDLLAAVVMPPLVYMALAFAGAAMEHSNLTGGWIRQQTIEMGSALVFGAPTLIIATVLSFSIALLRSRMRKAA